MQEKRSAKFECKFVKCKKFTMLLLRRRERLRSIVKSASVCVSVSVCLSVRQDISGTTRSIFTKFLSILPMSVAGSSSRMFTIGRIAYRRGGIFFPIDKCTIIRSLQKGSFDRQ